MKKSLINTLIVHNGSLGDLILSLPAIRCIREASELLHIAGKEGAVELLKQLNHADQVSSAGSAMFLSLYNNLPDKDAREFLGQFSRAYVFSKNRTPIVAESLRKIIPEVYIILTEPSGISLHVSDYQLQQLKGCAAEERAQFIQNVPIPLRQRAASVLAVNGITVGQKPFITMHPGSGGREKNWPSERFAELAGRIISHVSGTLTAQAFITTDLDDNQITAFHPGAMNHSHENRIGSHLAAGLAIVAPDGRAGMVAHVNELASARIPFMFDPGQGLPMFDGPELLGMIDAATYLAVNDYEGRMLVEKTGRPVEELARMVDALIVTKGASGSTIYAKGQRHDIPSVAPEDVVDPTGCGDAYRAGLLYGIAAGLDWPVIGRLASLMGAIKVASRGGQNHRSTRDEIGARYRRSFGASIL